MSATPVQQHFDEEASRYDRWKERNNVYYDTVKQIYRERIPADASVLEIGCGTGDILAEAKPRRGVGIDISVEMIERAKQKHPAYDWYSGTTADVSMPAETFDIHFLSDVIEHLEDVSGTFAAAKRFCKPGTKVYINMANPLWEPVLMLLEKLHMKMPEGPHYRISGKTLRKIMEPLGYQFVRKEYRLLCPARIPVISSICGVIERWPLVRRLCLIEIYTYEFRV